MSESSKAYLKRLTAVRANVATLTNLLDAHALDQGDHPTDWGYAGDLHHVDTVLSDLVQFLGNGDGME